MTFSKRMQNPKLLMVLGMSCLTVGTVIMKAPILTRYLGANWGDGLVGFLFGLSIALNLCAVRLASKRRQNQSGCTLSNART